jgi:hypothetical protein
MTYTLHITDNSQIMKFTPYSCQYVQQPWLCKYSSRVFRYHSNSHSQSFLSIRRVNFNVSIWVLFILQSYGYCTLWHWQEKQPYSGQAAGMSACLLVMFHLTQISGIISTFTFSSTCLLEVTSHCVSLYILWTIGSFWWRQIYYFQFRFYYTWEKSFKL